MNFFITYRLLKFTILKKAPLLKYHCSPLNEARYASENQQTTIKQRLSLTTRNVFREPFARCVCCFIDTCSKKNKLRILTKLISRSALSLSTIFPRQHVFRSSRISNPEWHVHYFRIYFQFHRSRPFFFTRDNDFFLYFYIVRDVCVEPSEFH